MKYGASDPKTTGRDDPPVNLFKAILLPTVIIAITLGTLGAIRSWHKDSTPSEKTEAEMNGIRTRFQAQLSLLARSALQFQKRTVNSERSREDLNDLYLRTSKELITTQAALTSVQEELVRTQVALKQALGGPGEPPNENPNSHSELRPPGSGDSSVPSPNSLKQTESLEEQITREIETLHQKKRDLNTVWDSYVNVAEKINKAERSLRGIQSDDDGSKTGESPSFVPPERPAITEIPEMPSDTASRAVNENSEADDRLKFDLREQEKRRAFLVKIEGIIKKLDAEIQSCDGKIWEAGKRLIDLEEKRPLPFRK